MAAEIGKAAGEERVKEVCLGSRGFNSNETIAQIHS